MRVKAEQEETRAYTLAGIAGQLLGSSFRHGEHSLSNCWAAGATARTPIRKDTNTSWSFAATEMVGACRCCSVSGADRVRFCNCIFEAEDASDWRLAIQIAPAADVFPSAQFV